MTTNTESCVECPAKKEKHSDGEPIAMGAGWLIHYVTLFCICLKISIRVKSRDFPGGPVAKNLWCSAGGVGT